LIGIFLQVQSGRLHEASSSISVDSLFALIKQGGSLRALDGGLKAAKARPAIGKALSRSSSSSILTIQTASMDDEYFVISIEAIDELFVSQIFRQFLRALL